MKPKVVHDVRMITERHFGERGATSAPIVVRSDINMAVESILRDLADGEKQALAESGHGSVTCFARLVSFTVFDHSLDQSVGMFVGVVAEMEVYGVAVQPWEQALAKVEGLVDRQQ